jgi:hypothetical protein
MTFSPKYAQESMDMYHEVMRETRNCGQWLTIKSIHLDHATLEYVVNGSVRIKQWDVVHRSDKYWEPMSLRERYGIRDKSQSSAFLELWFEYWHGAGCEWEHFINEMES